MHTAVSVCKCPEGLCKHIIARTNAQESALKVACGRKVPCGTRELNLCQQRTGQYSFVHVMCIQVRAFSSLDCPEVTLCS